MLDFLDCGKFDLTVENPTDKHKAIEAFGGRRRGKLTFGACRLDVCLDQAPVMLACI
jgi:hypothetical protein